MKTTIYNKIRHAAAICLVTAFLFLLAGCFFPEIKGGEEVGLSDYFLELEVGDRAVLTTKTQSEVSWLSGNEAIVTVDGGKVLAVGIGETVIYATAGGSVAECLVTVTQKWFDDGVTAPEEAKKTGYTLTWHDEFDGNTLNADNWSYQLGTKDPNGPANWGNNELQYYKEDNVEVKDGLLTITAKREEEGNKSYTSGRITSRWKFSCLYGYVEAKIKLPVTDGMWPAFWMLPQPPSTESSHNVYGGWARNGEIDIMEAKGRLGNSVGGALHFGDNSPKNQYKSKNCEVKEGIDQWHTYAVDWRQDSITWFVDGEAYFTLTNDQWWTAAVSSQENPYAPFDQPFYILLNLAVGGTFDPEGTENLKNDADFTSAAMSVDYVRVYRGI